MSSTTTFFDVTDLPTLEQLCAVAGTDDRIVVVGSDDNPLVVVMDARAFDWIETELHRLTELVADLEDQVDDLGDSNAHLEDDLMEATVELRAWEGGETEPTTSIEEAVQAFARHAARGRGPVRVVDASSGECNG